MKMEKTPMYFQLSKELEYSKDGVPDAKTATLELRAPGMDEFEEASNLSQLVMGAMLDVSRLSGKTRKDKEDEDVDLDATAIRLTLFSAQAVKFTTVAKCFNRLALKVGTTDGKIKLTETLLKKIGLEDYTRLICEYIANFTIPSLGLGQEQGEG